MQSIIDITLNDLRIIFQDRGVLLNLILFPLIIAYVVGQANGGGANNAKLLIDVLNQDNGAVSQQFLGDLRAANANLVLCPLDNDEKDVCQLNGAPLDEALAESRLIGQTSLALVEIPAGFTDDVSAGKNVAIIYCSNEDASAPSYILQAVQAVTQKLGGALIAAHVGAGVAAQSLNLSDPTLADSIRQKASALWAQNPVQVQYVVGAQVQAAPSGFQQSIPGIGTMYAMFMIFPAAAALVLERKNWTLQRLAAMPLARSQILGGKLLARFSTGILEYALIFTFGFILGTRYGSSPLAIALLVVAFTLAITALTLALTSWVRGAGQARGIALFLTLTLAPLGGAWWPLDIVPQWMRVVGHISPVAWVMDGFRSVIFYGGGLASVIVPILVLLGMTIVFFAIGVRRFKFTD